MNISNAVLLVDDEQNILSALIRVLKPLGLEVSTATNGTTALELARQDEFAAVITDMRMPGMDGNELLTRIAELQPNIRRIILTGYADLNQTIDSINLGKVHRYLTKPWNNEHLQSCIADELEVARQISKNDSERTELAAKSTALANKVAITSHVLEQSTCMMKSAKYESALDICDRLLRCRAPHLADLTPKIAKKCRSIGQAMSLQAEQLENLCIAAKLHQLGLLMLPMDITSKRVGKLNTEELALYQTHPTLGEQSIRGSSLEDDVAHIIRHHHEWFNGKGFPDRLVANYIPLESRIIAVVSSYEQVKAMYGKAAANEFMRLNSGTRYDPQIVDYLLASYTP
jgi:response regulator RpfG family c-di-GMP phosphodiesterase